MAELDDLRVRIEKLERVQPAPQRLNPFEDISFQLALESGHTVSARTRRLTMSNMEMNTDTGTDMNFPDGVTSSDLLHIAVPNDWVVGTGITINIMLMQDATGGSPLAVMNSFISVEKDGDTTADANIENAASISTNFPQNIVTLITRTIGGGDIEAADKIRWQVQRVGGHASDAINASLRFRSAWIEYTAFF